MKLTKTLKEWLVENHDGSLGEESSDDEFIKATMENVVAGKLTQEELVKLQADEGVASANRFESMIGEVLDGQKAINGRIDQIEQGAVAAVEPATGDKAGASDIEKALAGSPGEGSIDQQGGVRVKGAHERYDTTRKSGVYGQETKGGRRHPFAGQQVHEGGVNGSRRSVDESSELDLAVCGAYIKFSIHSQTGGRGIPSQLRMNDHDKELLQYALKNCKWAGVIKGVGAEDEGAMGVKNEKLSDWQQKAILDDATSGGLEIAPIEFDDAIIMTPLQFGEFFPRVNTVNITRGRRIEGGSIGNVTLTSGGADGTNIPLFNTASFITAFDTTIFGVNGAIEIGLDFLSDSPVDVAQIVTQQYGEVLLAWLDEQIAIGDGTTEPEGVMVAAGTTAVASTNGAGGPPTVGDYEGLLFGVPKRFKKGFTTDRIVYGGTETSYQRARAIAVGATDERRVFGMDHESYMLLNHVYGISDDMTNAQVFFANLARYRMYRRLGLTIRVTTEGQTLVRQNEMMISARARFGGQLEDGNSAAVTTDAQT